MILLRALPVLWAITIHEFAHGWMAHKCGDDTALYMGRLTLNPLAHLDPIGALMFLVIGFGWAKPVPVNPYNFRKPRRDDILVSLAGVSANLLSAAAFAVVLRVLVMVAGMDNLYAGVFSKQLSVVHIAVVVLEMGIFINLVLIFFNILPIPPLDGSHVLENLLPWRLREAYVTQIKPYGMFILAGLVLFGGSLLWLLIGEPAFFVEKILLGDNIQALALMIRSGI